MIKERMLQGNTETETKQTERILSHLFQSDLERWERELLEDSGNYELESGVPDLYNSLLRQLNGS